MKKIEVQNFQNLSIENVIINNRPLSKAKDVKENLITIVFVRDPYEYFDYLLSDYLKHQRSILFTQDIINNMEKLDKKSFLKWLDTINFIPFYNPQTFQLDISKGLLTAIENLESFDYVIPYEKIDIFLEHVSLDIDIHKKEEEKLLFSLSTQHDNEIISKFIGNDLKLYKRSLELWELVKKNNFKPLRLLIDRKQSPVKYNKTDKYKGIVGTITANRIVGWVYHKEMKESVEVAIYKNDTFLCIVKANTMRPDLKKEQIHPTGICGFRAIFEEKTFQKGDNVEIKILPDQIILPLGINAKIFLGK